MYTPGLKLLYPVAECMLARCKPTTVFDSKCSDRSSAETDKQLKATNNNKSLKMKTRTKLIE